VGLAELKIPPVVSALLRAVWAAVPQADKDEIAAFAIREAKAAAWWGFKWALSYARRRITEGAPPEMFGDLDAFQRAPPFPMPEGGMPVPGPSSDPQL